MTQAHTATDRLEQALREVLASEIAAERCTLAEHYGYWEAELPALTPPLSRALYSRGVVVLDAMSCPCGVRVGFRIT